MQMLLCRRDLHLDLQLHRQSFILVQYTARSPLPFLLRISKLALVLLQILENPPSTMSTPGSSENHFLTNTPKVTTPLSL
jgi:hypothetical protein